ncbi:hypothetical protein GW17_00048085, partial [Ensete ventricosum]
GDEDRFVVGPMECDGIATPLSVSNGGPRSPMLHPVRASDHQIGVLRRLLLLGDRLITNRARVFNRFIDEKGNLKASLRHQTEGLMSLYEASHLAKEGEHVLEEAIDFTTKQLKSLMEGSLEPHLREHVAHALELPLNWRMPRLHTSTNFWLSIRWWSNLGLAQKLPFSRDRLVENYFWTLGWVFEPQFGRCRELHTKANCFIVTIDDVYDIYGTMDELELFTDAVAR